MAPVVTAMPRRRLLGGAAAVILLGGTVAVSTALLSRGEDRRPGAVYLDRTRPAAERAADLVSRMTLEEKASQLISSQAPAIPRLGVPAYGWWNEAIHGVAREQTNDGDNPPTLVNTTSYPVSLSLASTWNPQTVHRVSGLISDEMREVVRGNNLDLNVYSPTVNLSRDPRWGRNDETYGEDPVLTSAIAAQYVNGMEGKDETGRPLPEGGGYLKTSTTLKHYAANNSEAERLSGTSDMDERTLREYYTAQFRAIVRSSSPGSIMTAYNRVNGVPASASSHLMQVLGRQTFGFTGFYTSDCDSVSVMTNQQQWTPADKTQLDGAERSARANAAGLDLNCQMGYHDDDNFANTLPDAVHRGVAVESGRYTEDSLDASAVRLFTARFRLGEFDDATTVPWVTRARAAVPAGSWTSSDANHAVTETPQRLAAARESAAESLVLLKNAAAPGRAPLLPLKVPASGPYKLAVVGYACSRDGLSLGGYSSDQTSAGAAKEVPGFEGLRDAVRRIDPQASVDYLPGVTSLAAEQVDAKTLAAVAGYDAVVVCAATDPKAVREDRDRAGLALSGAQESLVRQVAARNPRTAVYLQTAGPVDVRAIEPAVPALLWSAYNGQRTGEALADVLLGVVDPSGHLPFTWYRDDGQLPPIGDYRIRPAADGNPGRTYQYFTGTPSYPFGWGLGYTTFRHSAPRLSTSRTGPDGQVVVGVDVTNTGRVAGSDVVQLYVSTPGASPALQRPRQRLIGFRKVRLEPGATTHVEVPVRVADLAFYDEKAARFAVDQGTYRFAVGSSSAVDPAGHADLAVSGSSTPSPAVVTARPAVATDGAPAPARLIYPAGVEIAPRLTVAMTDDTLVGCATPQACQALPPGLEVRYGSDRPEVVQVSAGTVRTRGAGVATVTATVGQGGRTVSTSFVVVVR